MPADATVIGNQSRPSLRELINRHRESSAILAAAGVALDAKVSGTELQPAIKTQVDEVLAVLGIADIEQGVSVPELRQMLAEIRINLLLDAKLLLHAGDPLAWNHMDGVILQAGGDVSAGFATTLKNNIAPKLDGLEQRLNSGGAAFLDVGVGVAGLSIAMAQLWPALHVLGIDPWAPSLAIAHENVKRARLAERIQLRKQRAEELSDSETFDLAWMPSVFMPAQSMPTACERVHHALRPGGWLLFAVINPGSDPVSASLARLRTVFWGGSPFNFIAIEKLLGLAGYGDVRMLPSPPGAIIGLVAGRRPLPRTPW